MSTKLRSDFTTGPLFWRITLFAIPIILTSLLQVIYGMADNIVVGRFSNDDTAVAAIGSTATILSFIVNVVVGFSAGSSVVVARSIGSRDDDAISKSIHTTVGIAVILGVACGLLGFSLTVPLLRLLGTKEELMAGATLYLRIIFCGVPFQIVYNFCAAIQRSAGNSKISLQILGFTGLLNVVLNLIFVLFLNMTVDGVATATAVSHVVSAALIILSLVRRQDNCKLVLKKIRINIPVLKRIVKLGLPSGIQAGTFAMGTMVMQSAFNTLSTATVYANTVLSNVDNLAATTMNAYSASTTTFVGQNYGARNYARVKKSYIYSIIWGVLAAVVCGQLALHFAEPIASLYVTNTNPLYDEIIVISKEMLSITLNTLVFLAVMNITTGVLRSLGYSIHAMVASICGVIGARIGWIVFVFYRVERFNSGAGLIISFPLSWGITAAALTVLALIAMRKTKKKFAKDSIADNPD